MSSSGLGAHFGIGFVFGFVVNVDVGFAMGLGPDGSNLRLDLSNFFIS
jgi:hypothetical protein